MSNSLSSFRTSMSSRGVKRVLQVFGVLHLIFGVALVYLAAYTSLSFGGWLTLPVLIPASIYFLSLGCRVWKSPSAGVVRQVCFTISLVIGLPCVSLVDY